MVYAYSTVAMVVQVASGKYMWYAINGNELAFLL
jgi:hypothetical protein